MSDQQNEESSYYEEEVISDDEESIEQVDENGFPIIRSDASADFVDDDSSTPPPSLEGHKSGSTTWQESFTSFDIVADVAAQEGARKASLEAIAREEFLQRKVAREALQKKRRGNNSAGQPEFSATSLEDPAMQILMERLEQVEVAMAARSSPRGASKTRAQVLGTNALEKRKQSLVELRRLMARDQLAQNVNELKSGQTTL